MPPDYTVGEQRPGARAAGSGRVGAGRPGRHTPQRGMGWLPIEMQTFFISQKVSRLASPPSRPTPES